MLLASAQGPDSSRWGGKVVLPQQRFFCMPVLQLAGIRSVLTGTHPSRPFRPACYALVGGQRCLTDSANPQGAARRSTAPDLKIIVRTGPADRL